MGGVSYSEKLKDPRWADLRAEFRASRITELGILCENCGLETQGRTQVHHKRYIRGREPWEYDFAELRLLCEDCHTQIHATEAEVRALCLSLHPHECNEMEALVIALAIAQEQGTLNVALARAKNAALAGGPE